MDQGFFPGKRSRKLKASVEVKVLLSVSEYVALRKMAHEKDLTYQQLLIQGLRVYQLTDKFPAEFEQFTRSVMPPKSLAPAQSCRGIKFSVQFGN